MTEPTPPRNRAQERSLFLQAVEIDDLSERNAFLTQARGDDQALRRRLEQLLSADTETVVGHVDTSIGHDDRDPFAATVQSTETNESSELEATLIGGNAVGKPQTPESSDATEANPDSPVPFVYGRRIAKGGMGAILEADDCKLGRKIAVKVMLPNAELSEDGKQRFIQEAAVLGKLEHPNIVPIHDLGRDKDGQLYYSMKLVVGRTLQDIINDLRKEDPATLKHYTVDRLLTVFRKICDAMAFAHAENIIHRDLKPENVMVGEFGEVLVMDWGLSKILDGRADIAAPVPLQTSDSNALANASLSATLEGSVMGTPKYMSPEQAAGEIGRMDARSDIFSLGGILYAILTLHPPVEGKDVYEVLEKVQSGDLTPPSDFGSTSKGTKSTAKGEVLEAKTITPLPHVPSGRVPSALSAVAMKALELKKENRYQVVGELSEDIENWQGGFATTAEEAGLWKQMSLLIKRHKTAFTTATVAWAIITGLALWFVINLQAKERRAVAEEKRAAAGEKRALAQEERAIASEQEAVAQEERALAGEKLAVAEQHKAEAAVAKTVIALADVALKENNSGLMQQLLDEVPVSLRDSDWSYLMERTDTSILTLQHSKRRYKSVDAHPKFGCFWTGRFQWQSLPDACPVRTNS